jgi:hypothetical protein
MSRLIFALSIPLLLAACGESSTNEKISTTLSVSETNTATSTTNVVATTNVVGPTTLAKDDAVVSTFVSSSDLIPVLKSAGLDCVNLILVGVEDREIGQEDAKEVAECELEGQNIRLSIWQNSEQNQKYISQGLSMSCEMGKSFGLTQFDFVVGETWSIIYASEQLSTKIAENLGAKAVHTVCD